MTAKNRKKPDELRSHRWYGVNDLRSSATGRAPRRWATTAPITSASP